MTSDGVVVPARGCLRIAWPDEASGNPAPLVVVVGDAIASVAEVTPAPGDQAVAVGPPLCDCGGSIGGADMPDQ